MARQEWEREQEDPEGDGEEGRVGRLGEEEHRDALDVGDHLAPLGHDIRKVGEPAVEQDQPRHGLGGRRTGVHGDSDVGLLDGERVVDAVPRHRDGVPRRLERHDDPPLLVGRDAPEDDELVQHPKESLLAVGQVAGVETAWGVEAHVPGDRRDRLGIVAGDDAHRHVLRREVGEGLGRVGAEVLPKGEQRDGDGIERHRLIVRRRPVGEHEGASARGRERGRAEGEVLELGRGGAGGAEHHLRPAEHPHPAAEHDGAPLPCRRERDPIHGNLADRLREWTREAAGGRVGIVLHAVPGEHPLPPRNDRERMHLVERDVALGEGSGLVEADHVHPREPLDRGEFLHEHLQACKPDRSHREGDARHEDEPQGHHRDDGGHRGRCGVPPGPGRGGLAPSAERHHLGVQHEQRDRTDDPGHPLEHPVDGGPQLRGDEGESLRLGGEGVRERCGPHPVDHGGPLTCDHDGPGQHPVAGHLLDGVGFAGEHGFIDLECK